jgi:hypothetical protein
VLTNRPECPRKFDGHVVAECARDCEADNPETVDLEVDKQTRSVI